MKISATQTGFALYKEADIIGQCDVTPTPKGADITALSVLPQWRRKGYGSYLLKEILRRFGGYDREAATVFTAPLPADEGEGLFWQKFGFAPEDGRLVRRRTPDLTAVRFVQDYLAAHLPHPKPSTRPSGPARRQRNAVSPPLPQVASMQRRGCASRAARKSCTNLTAVRSGVRRRTSCLPSAAKPNFAQNASSAASAGSGAVNTVAFSRSYPA